MKNIIIAFILILPGSFALAQNPYIKFIENKNISWAATYNGAVWFNELNLSLLLRKRFSKKEIKAANPDKLAIENSFEYISVRDASLKIDPTFGEDNSTGGDPLFSAKYYPAEVNKQIEVQQLFFVEKGEIRSAVNMVSPQFNVVTPAGTFLGTGNVFTTAFNDKKELKRLVRKKSQRAGITTVDFEKLKIQKQVYGLDLPACIWPYLDSRYTIIRLDSNKVITKDAINTSLATVQVPVYDENGNLLTPVIATAPLTPDSFTIGEIEQEWFYNKKKNIVFAVIKSLTLNFSKTAVIRLIPR